MNQCEFGTNEVSKYLQVRKWLHRSSEGREGDELRIREEERMRWHASTEFVTHTSNGRGKEASVEDREKGRSNER